jgi:hypothetical protein
VLSGAGMPYAALIEDPALMGTTQRVFELIAEARKKKG